MVSLSRTGNTSTLGKMTAQFPGFKADEETFEGATKLAREAGLSLAEWQRTLVMVRVHGIGTVTRMHENRLRVVSGMNREKIEELS